LLVFLLFLTDIGCSQHDLTPYPRRIWGFETDCEPDIKSGSFFLVVIPLTHHKNSGYTELKVLGVRRSIILLFTAFLVGVLKG
ncbi:hypothetical protein, partial [uncultured Ruminococcus sp.]|uniref:hypothetical protein n=1 Tax=uncultured Ruminococcus sp. TaxID=165186 RepID=UPI0025F79E76